MPVSIHAEELSKQLIAMPVNAQKTVSVCEGDDVYFTFTIQRLHLGECNVFALCDTSGVNCEAYVLDNYVPFQDDQPDEDWKGCLRFMLLYLLSSSEEYDLLSVDLPTLLQEKLRALRDEEITISQLAQWFASYPLSVLA